MTQKVVFWPEFNPDRGTGHIHECCCLSDAMEWDSLMLTPPWDAAKAIADQYEQTVLVSEVADMHSALKELRATGYETVVIDHFSVSLEDQKALQAAGYRVVVIDQTGNKQISADLLVNPSPVKDWHEYHIINPETCQALFGVEYFLLRRQFREAQKSEKTFLDAPRRILVSMGGVDRTGATLRVIEALQKLPTSVHKEIIIGPGFRHLEKLGAKFRRRFDKSFHFYEAVQDMERHMMRCDLLVSAGGTTLLEAAALGLPAIVLWEDPHEETYARSLPKACGVDVLGNGMDVDLDVVAQHCFDSLADKARRKAISRTMKAYVDGNGAARIASAILGMRQA